MYYESEEDVRLRLSKSVVRLGEQPVYVEGTLSKDRVVICLLEEGDRKECDIKDLNLLPVPLGYIQTRAGAVYASRRPVRRYKQGLNDENMVALDVFTKAPVRLPVTSKEVCRTILGKYPPVGEAFQQVREGKLIVPFSREWAVANYKEELCVMYKGNVVGYVGDDNVMLSPDKYFLKESLMEALNV